MRIRFVWSQFSKDGTEQCEIIDAKIYEERERIENERRHLRTKSAAEKPKAPIPFDPPGAPINTPLPKTTMTMELAHQFNRFGIGLDSTVSSISICSNGTKEIEIINFDGKRYQIIEKTRPGIEPQFTVVPHPHDINVQTSVVKNQTSSSIKNHMQSCSWCSNPSHRKLSCPHLSEAIRNGQVHINKANRIVNAISGKEISRTGIHHL